MVPWRGSCQRYILFTRQAALWKQPYCQRAIPHPMPHLAVLLKCSVSSPGDLLAFSLALHLSVLHPESQAGALISALHPSLSSWFPWFKPCPSRCKKEGGSSSRLMFDISTDAFYPRWFQTAFYSAIPPGLCSQLWGRAG